MDKLYIVMPAYNEEKNIDKVIDEWYPIVEKYHGNESSRLVIINDGSKDNTYKIASDQKQNRPLLEVLEKPNSGHGATVLYAYDYALNHSADFIFQTDSDGQTNPEEFHEFWNQRNDFDLLIGHRNHREDGFSRILVTKTLKLILKLKFGVSIKDANTPFRLMSFNSLKDCRSLVPNDFNLSNVILTIAYYKKGKKVKFLPISFRPRQGGVNSINLLNIFNIGKKAIKDFQLINKNISETDIPDA